MKNPYILAVVGKGGTGKTTSSVALSYEFARAGQRVTLIDCDPQASCTQALGADPVADPFTASPVSLGLQFPPDALQGSLKLLPGGRTLTAATKAQVVSHITRGGAASDIVVVDTVPLVSAITLGAISSAHVVVVTLQPAPLPMSGLKDLLETCRQINSGAVVRAMFTLAKPRRAMLSRVQDALNSRYPGLLYPVYVPDDAPCEAATSRCVPVGLFDARCKSAMAYRELASHVYGDLDQRAQRQRSGVLQHRLVTEAANVAR